MMQSVYVSGFRGVDPGQLATFGWYYGAPAYTSTVRSGGYSTFALLLVPRAQDGAEEEVNVCPIEIDGSTFWKDRKDRIDTGISSLPILSPGEQNPSMASIEHINTRPMIRQVQYAPHYGAADALAKDLNTISLEFVDPVNPNLLLEASGKLLKRVRDWRGRATSPGANTVSISDSDGNAKQVSLARGLFEADIDETNTWIAISRTKIMIKLDSATAGTTAFPDLRFLTPGAKDWSLTDLMDYTTYDSTITIGDSTFLACHPKPAAFVPTKNEGCMQQPLSMWLPLFMTAPAIGHTLQVTPVSPVSPLFSSRRAT